MHLFATTDQSVLVWQFLDLSLKLLNEVIHFHQKAGQPAGITYLILQVPLSFSRTYIFYHLLLIVAQAFSEPHQRVNFSIISRVNFALLAFLNLSTLILSMIVQLAFLIVSYLIGQNLGYDLIYLLVHVLVHLSNAF